MKMLHWSHNTSDGKSPQAGKFFITCFDSRKIKHKISSVYIILLIFFSQFDFKTKTPPTGKHKES